MLESLYLFYQIDEYDKQIARFQDDEKELVQQKKKFEDHQFQLQAAKDSKYDQQIADLGEKIEKFDKKLRNLREARYFSKVDIAVTNRYTDEGVCVCVSHGCVYVSMFMCCVCVFCMYACMYACVCVDVDGYPTPPPLSLLSAFL